MIQEWQISNGTNKKIQVQLIRGHQAQIETIAFNPRGDLIASGGFDGTIRIWSLPGGQKVAVFLEEEIVTSLCFHPNNQLLLSSSFGGGVKIRNLRTKKLEKINSYHALIVTATFSPSGQFIAFAEYQTGNIIIWDTFTKTELTKIKDQIHGRKALSFLSEKYLIIGSLEDRRIKIYNIENDQFVPYLNNGCQDCTIHSISYNANLKLLACGNKEGHICLWNFKTGQKIKKWQKHSKVINDLSFSPCQKIMASASSDQTIKLWPIAFEESTEQTLFGHQDIVTCAEFNSVSHIFASASRDKTIMFCPTSELLRNFS